MRATLDRARRNGDDGFTLIELLIVIVILGILAAIVVFSVRGITDKGSTAACKTSISTVDTAFEAYAAQQANPSSVLASAVTLGTLAPTYLHSVPDKIGSTAVTSSTTVSTVDGLLSSC